MKIGELAKAAVTTAKTLRFYEEQGLLPVPDRTPMGYRDYPPEMLARLAFIHRGQAASLTLAQIKQVLDIRDDGHAPCEHVQELLDQRLSEIGRQLRDLASLRDTLIELREQAAATESDNCGPDEVCIYL